MVGPKPMKASIKRGQSQYLQLIGSSIHDVLKQAFDDR